MKVSDRSKATMVKNLCAIVLGFAIFLQAINASAFKVGTHVWIAQQVLNDVLPDGKVIIGQWEYKVDDDVLSALRNHQDKYRMGNAGPDGFPDLIVPQITTHPGVDGAWQSDDWLRWMLANARSEQEKAFAYGYLGHAATDVFAHTYINMYTGDVFLLTDGEIDNEYRHFALETYIDNHKPPLLDYSGADLTGKPDKVSAPSRFLADNLILNEIVAHEYLQVSTKAATHLVSMLRVRSSLDRAIQLSDVGGLGSGLQTLGANPVRQRLVSWRDDVDKAVVAYVDASSDAVRELMKPGGMPLKPILYWKACWGPVFLAVPRQIPQGTCPNTHNIEAIDGDINNLRAALGPLALVADPLNEIKRFVDDELKTTLNQASTDIARNVGGKDTETLVRLMHGGVNADELNRIFSKDSFGKGLPLIPDVAPRVDADMHLTRQGYFDPAQFQAIHDAIVLTKLTLLRAPQLNQLVRDAGVEGPTLYGPQLYGGGPDPFNILLEAVRSVDGNHQWLGLAPPFPRRPGFKDAGWPDRRHYGYDFRNDTRGFRLWVDPQAREKVFNKIFSIKTPQPAP